MKVGLVLSYSIKNWFKLIISVLAMDKFRLRLTSLGGTHFVVMHYQ